MTYPRSSPANIDDSQDNRNKSSSHQPVFADTGAHSPIESGGPFQVKADAPIQLRFTWNKGSVPPWFLVTRTVQAIVTPDSFTGHVQQRAGDRAGGPTLDLYFDLHEAGWIEELLGMINKVASQPPPPLYPPVGGPWALVEAKQAAGPVRLREWADEPVDWCELSLALIRVAQKSA